MVMQVVMMPRQHVSKTMSLSPGLSYLEKSKGVNYPPAPRQTPEENLIQLSSQRSLRVSTWYKLSQQCLQPIRDN